MSCKLCGAPWTIKIINDPYYGEYNMLMCAGSIPHTRPIPLANMTADLAFRARTAQMMGE